MSAEMTAFAESSHRTVRRRSMRKRFNVLARVNLPGLSGSDRQIVWETA
jgi:hypothetical protein